MTYQTFMRQLGAAVRARRLELGLTQAELASKVDGLDQSAISRIEGGDQGLRVETLNSLAKALRTRLYRLVGGADPKHNWRTS